MSFSFSATLLVGGAVVLFLLVGLLAFLSEKRDSQLPKRRAPIQAPESMVQPLLDTLQVVASRSGDGHFREMAEAALRDWDVRAESLSGSNGVKL